MDGSIKTHCPVLEGNFACIPRLVLPSVIFAACTMFSLLVSWAMFSARCVVSLLAGPDGYSDPANRPFHVPRLEMKALLSR